MTTWNWASISNGATLTGFNPTTDILAFNSKTSPVTAFEVTMEYSATRLTGVSFSAFGKTIYMPSTIAATSLTGRVTFAGDGGFFFGTGGNDHFASQNWNTAYNDQLHGFGGDDNLDGGAGNDKMVGGAGSDRYQFDNPNDVAIETDPNPLTGGVDTIYLDYLTANYTLPADVENLTFKFGTGVGNELDNRIDGDGNMYGLGGNDSLYSRGSGNRLEGGNGNDSYYILVDGYQVRVVELDADQSVGGIDTVYSGVDFFALDDNVERLVLIDDYPWGKYGVGNDLANEIIGNSNSNILHGMGGADFIDGGPDSPVGDLDTMEGGDGDDIYVVDYQLDKVIETNADRTTGGVDRVNSRIAAYTLPDNVENLMLVAGGVNGAGNALANEMTGNDLANVLSGLAGKDTLVGGGGNDRLIGGGGADTMLGGAGDDTYVVDNFRDRLFETTTSTSDIDAGGNDIVISSISFSLEGAGLQFVERLSLSGTGATSATGNNLANIIIGNAADNSIDGGLGADRLTGGLGLDNFVLDSALGSTNIDRITDFSAADDTVVLDQTIFTALTATGTLAGDAFWEGTTAHDANDRVIYNPATGNLFYDADGLGGAAAVRFAQVTAGLALTNADFLIIA